MSRDMTIHLIAGDLVRVTLVAEAVSWSPDVAADMVTRAVSAFEQAVKVAVDQGLLGEIDDEDADEETEAPTDGAD